MPIRRPRHNFRSRRPRLDVLEDRSVPSSNGLIGHTQLMVDKGSFDPSSILVRFNDPGPGPVLPFRAVGTTVDHAIELVPGLYQMKLSKGMSVAAALDMYQANPAVRYAEPNFLIHVENAPNDPKYLDGTLWGMNNTGQSGGTADADIDAPEAWDLATGSSSMVVAVIDTGVDYNHPDLAANIWSNATEANGLPGVDDDGNGFVDDIRGWDFANNDNNPMDDHSHGTHVSGTIGAIGNNGIGVVGVNWNVQIMPLKFLNAQGNGTTAAAIAALQYAVANGAKISNHSYGDTAFSQAHLDAIQAAGAADHLVVAAAGNGNFFGQPINNDVTPFYPASYQPAIDNVISVAATTRTDAFASFSNYGAASVDLAAPGVSIYSTMPNNAYGFKDGTSMAAPHVTGAAALLWSSAPGQSVTEVKQRLLDNTDSIAALNPNRPTVTNGRLNIFKALNAGQPGLPTLSISDASVTEGNSGTVAVDFTVTLSATSTQDVTVNFATANGTASAADYAGGSSTVTILAGQTTATITIQVNGDDLDEANETYFVNLSGPVNATIADGQGLGTILDDDPAPSLSISDVAVLEGDRGTTIAVFTISLGTASGQSVTVNFATANATASSGTDYTSRSGSVTFAPGETTKTIEINIKGDRKKESDETFFVNLSSPANATILDGQGLGTILNDD